MLAPAKMIGKSNALASLKSSFGKCSPTFFFLALFLKQLQQPLISHLVWWEITVCEKGSYLPYMPDMSSMISHFQKHKF